MEKTASSAAGSKGFLDFVVDLSKLDVETGYKRLKKLESLALLDNAESVYSWFRAQGYEISIEDCMKIIESRDSIQNGKDIMRFNTGY